MWDLSSLIRNWTWFPCIARWILNHWITREVPDLFFNLGIYLGRLYMSGNVDLSHFFLTSVHHSYTSYMSVFNCLIEFCCTISRFSHPFLSIPLLSGFAPRTVTDSGQWAIRYKFLCVHMREFLWVKGMCIYRISTNCRILLWSSCIN